MPMVELVWEGKYVDGRRNGPTRIELPFQTVETANESAQDRQRSLELFVQGRPGPWRNRLIWGDKKYVLPSLLRDLSGKVDLVYIDPPFDTGADFSFRRRVPESDEDLDKQPSVLELKAYRDIWGKGVDSYLQFIYETLVLLHELLSPNGLLLCHFDDNVGHEVKQVLDEVFGRDKYRGEIIWELGTGAKSRKFFSIQHNTLYAYSKGDEWYFDSESKIVRQPFAEGSLKTHFKKVDESGRHYRIRHVGGKDYKYYADEGRLLGSVWTDVSSMSANSPILDETTAYPTQKPLKLLERIITACCPPDGLVLDCFCGSGTTAVAAERLHRRWVAADLGRFAIHTTRERLLSTPGMKPFVVENLGRYERQVWMRAEFESDKRAAIETSYRRFIVELFGGQSMDGSAWVHGVKERSFVHVGPVDAPVTLADLREIAGEAHRMRPDTDALGPRVEVLGWDFAFELNETARQIAAEANIRVSFRRIPREVLDKRAIEQGDIGAKDFFELRALTVNLDLDGKVLRLKLAEFIIPPDDLPDSIARTITHWSQWVDYWAIDWDYRSVTFHNQWQSYRTRRYPSLELQATHEYEKPGTYTVGVKVIDILGNDTTKLMPVEVR